MDEPGTALAANNLSSQGRLDSRFLRPLRLNCAEPLNPLERIPRQNRRMGILHIVLWPFPTVPLLHERECIGIFLLTKGISNVFFIG